MIIVRNVYTAICRTHPVPTAGRKANRRVRTMVEKPTDGEKPRPLAIERVEPPDITSCSVDGFIIVAAVELIALLVLGLRCSSIRRSGGPADGLPICV